MRQRLATGSRAIPGENASLIDRTERRDRRRHQIDHVAVGLKEPGRAEDVAFLRYPDKPVRGKAGDQLVGSGRPVDSVDLCLDRVGIAGKSWVVMLPDADHRAGNLTRRYRRPADRV